MKNKTLLMRLQILTVAMAILPIFPGAYGKAEAQKSEVVIGSVRINGNEINKEGGAIAISKRDSLAINYLVNRRAGPDERFFYRISLSDGKDSSVQVTGASEAIYKGLSEGSYYFSVGAFDLQGKWNAKNASLKFFVDEKLSSQLKELKSLKSKPDKDKNPSNTSFEKAGQDSSTNAYYYLGGLLALAAVAGLSYFAIKSRRSDPAGMNGDGKKSGTIAVSIVELDKLRRENGELIGQISALRGQIDALQYRSDELRARNRELEGNVARLSKSKDELEELQLQKDELFTIILHDIKNPISLIKSLVELLRSYDLTANEQQEIIDDIAETTIKIVSLSHEVSKILALESSHLKINLEKTDIAQLISDVVTRNGISSKNKEISVMEEISSNLPNVHIDISKIDEVLDNLVSNAIKFTQRGGSVKISARSEGDNVVVEVADNGPGLSESDIEAAFQRGNRLSAQPTGGESSTGLGLWIVKKLVEAHRGRVWIKSVLGKGATFAFSLPINPEPKN
ncbi:MAG: ATP-binding protein [Chloroflexota bacterium]